MKQVKAADIELNIFRLGNPQSSPYLVHVDGLSALLEKKRKKAMNSHK
ncbi:pyocin activator PrtN family protein [Alteromonas sp.]